MKKLIYFDNAASTPINNKVIKNIISFIKKNNYGNASSKHCFGLNLKLHILKAKKYISNIINAKHNEIIFTSCTTESNNLAIKGLMKPNKEIIINKDDHPSIINTCKSIIYSKTIFVKTHNTGLIKNIDIVKNINFQTQIISISHINSKTGAIQNIKSIGMICKIFNIIFHVDATQSIGKTIIDIKKNNIKLLSISSHKIYGPQGIAALFIKSNLKKIIQPIIHGGGQEYNIRSGSLPTYLIIGFGIACKIAKKKYIYNRKHIYKLNKYFLHKINKIKQIKIIKIKNKIPDIINITTKKYTILKHINNSIKYIAFSHGSSCDNYKKKKKKKYIRISLGIQNKKKEIKIFINKIKKIINFYNNVNKPEWRNGKRS